MQGLVRDPQEVLASSVGQTAYSSDKSITETLQQYLSTVSPAVSLPQETMLQVLTHKSFAHGSKPYNANLAYIGEQLLQLVASKNVLAKNSSSVGNVAGVSFDAIGSLAHRLIWSDKFLASFAEQKGIDKVFFCRLAQSEYKPKKIFSTITTGLIGAIAAQHGKKAAEEFIQNEIIPAYESQVKEQPQQEPEHKD